MLMEMHSVATSTTWCSQDGNQLDAVLCFITEYCKPTLRQYKIQNKK